MKLKAIIKAEGLEAKIESYGKLNRIPKILILYAVRNNFIIHGGYEITL